MKRAAARALLKRAFAAAVQAAHPASFLSSFLPQKVQGRTVAVAAGKAAVELARSFAASYEGAYEGLLAASGSKDPKVPGFVWLDASHPLPDAKSQRAGRAVLAAAQGLGSDDQLIVLLSGGASAMLCVPHAGVSLAEKRSVVRQLLLSGANISEFNCVRRALSAIKGGRLAAAAYPAATATIALSDVAGDNPADIASGPTVSSPTDCTHAREVLTRYDIRASASVARCLAGRGAWPAAARMKRARFVIASSAQNSLDASCAVLRSAGFRPVNLGSCITGEASQAAEVIVGIAQAIASQGALGGPPATLVCGGELTVSGATAGRGGPNCEFALAAALKMGCLPAGSMLLSGDTDGIDGNARAAGAIVDAQLATSAQLRASAYRALQTHRSADFLEKRAALFKTGPTGVNVNDFRTMLIGI